MGTAQIAAKSCRRSHRATDKHLAESDCLTRRHRAIVTTQAELAGSANRRRRIRLVVRRTGIVVIGLA